LLVTDTQAFYKLDSSQRVNIDGDNLGLYLAIYDKTSASASSSSSSFGADTVAKLQSLEYGPEM